MPVGRTNDAGWEVGVSRTVGHPVDRVWTFLTSRAGLDLWLGAGAAPAPEPGATYAAADGTRGEVRSWHRLDRVRLTWQPEGWDHETTVQVTVRARGERTTVGFHQERMVDGDERVRQRDHWRAVMDRIETALDRSHSDDEEER
jgi:uncharacterized protein YndB with AHSA1/START domain